LVAIIHHQSINQKKLAINNGYELVKFFFLLTFAAAIAAIISGVMPNVPGFTRKSPHQSLSWL